jgi:hypothetical protein
MSAGNFSSQGDFQMKVALEDNVREKSELVYKLKETIYNLNVEILEKEQQREELRTLYDSKSTEFQ